MKAMSYAIHLMITVFFCSGTSSLQNLTWYKNAQITSITEDPDRPAEFIRVSIGISAQVFYIQKKSPDCTSLLKKATQSFRKNVHYHIGIENKTNIIRQIKEIK